MSEPMYSEKFVRTSNVLSFIAGLIAGVWIMCLVAIFII